MDLGPKGRVAAVAIAAEARGPEGSATQVVPVVADMRSAEDIRRRRRLRSTGAPDPAATVRLAGECLHVRRPGQPHSLKAPRRSAKLTHGLPERGARCSGGR